MSSLPHQSLDRAAFREQNEVSIEALYQELISYKCTLEDFIARQTSGQMRSYLKKMLVKSNGRLIIVRTDEIDWIEAWGDYVRLHCKGKSHIIHRKIGEIETRLDPQRFLRIGRSAIINADRIKEMGSMNHGDYLITLHDNTQLNLSRNYRNCLSAMFDNHL